MAGAGLALVTGGTKRLGAAIATRLAESGYDLALHCHSAGATDSVLAETIARCGVESRIFLADLADGEAVDGLIPAVVAHFGRAPGVLVNSASRFGEDRWADVSLDSLEDHFRVNAAAPARLSQAFASALGDGEGVIVNILDQRIVSPPDDQAGYTASKLALAGITQAMARALAPRVRVCGVAPGLTLPTSDYDETQVAKLADLMPLRRLPTPNDVAQAVEYLVAAKATTGQVLFVDGGASMRSYDRDFVALGRG